MKRLVTIIAVFSGSFAAGAFASAAIADAGIWGQPLAWKVAAAACLVVAAVSGFFAALIREEAKS